MLKHKTTNRIIFSRKALLFCPTILVLIIVIYIFVISKILSSSFPRPYKSYNEAQIECNKFLKDNLKELTVLAEKYLDNPNLFSQSYKSIILIRHEKSSLGEIYINFKLGELLGDLEWGLYYIPENKYLGKSEKYIYNGNKRENNKNIIIVKKLRDYWFFYYVDYNGELDVTKIK